MTKFTVLSLVCLLLSIQALFVVSAGGFDTAKPLTEAEQKETFGTGTDGSIKKDKKKKTPSSGKASAVSATATLPGTNGISGTFKFNLVHGFPLTAINITINGLSPGKYPYHIHEKPVVDEDCATALGHFNPTNLAANVFCDAINPLETCQSGDLSGMFNPLPGGAVQIVTYSPLLKFSPPHSSFVGRSVVIHSPAPELKRLACANIIIDTDAQK